MCAWGQAKNVVAGRVTLFGTACFPNFGKGVPATTQYLEIACSDLFSPGFFFSAVIKMTKKNWKIQNQKKKSLLHKNQLRMPSMHICITVLLLFFPPLVGNLSDAPVRVAAVWQWDGMLYIYYIYIHTHTHAYIIQCSLIIGHL